MTPSSDVVVIGGGVVGAATGRALAQAGHRVTLLQGPPIPGEAWRASAGMLAAQIEAGRDEPMFNLALAGRAFYHREVPRLEATTGIDLSFQETGILQVAATEAHAMALRAKVAWQRQQAQQADWLEPEEVLHNWPWLIPGQGAFWAAGDGLLDPQNLAKAFLADAVLAGARIIDDRGVALIREDGMLHGVQGERARYPTDTVVLSAGAWSGRVANLPRPLSVEPVRGQLVAFRGPAEITPGVVYGDHCYLVRRGNELIAGATMEHAGFDASTSDLAAAEIIERVSVLFATLVDATPLRTWAGLRPGTPDGVPIIGPEPRLPGLWYATGHGRNGILLAGITGELVAQGISGEALPDDLDVARPERFWNW